MSLDPNVLRCAKQVYNHLGLSDRINQNLNSSTLFPEVIKMKQLLESTNKDVLDEAVKGFLRWKPPRQRKKTLSDFTSQIEHEISTLLQEDLFDDIDEEALQSIDSQKMPSNKRTSEPLDDSVTKKHKVSNLASTSTVSTRIYIPRPPPLECFSADTSQLDGYNFICSPAKPTKLFVGVSWIVLFEIARFLDNCKVPWDEIPFQAFRTFLDVGSTEPKKLFEAMIRWNIEERLGQRLNGLTYSRMIRCADSVWSYVQTEALLADIPTPKEANATETDLEETGFTTSKNNTKSLKKSSDQTFKVNITDIQEQNLIKQKLLRNRMIRYSGIITFKSLNEAPKITLRTPKVASSNRFFRKFGHDRFLEIVLNNSSNPSMVKKFKDYLLKPFLLMQRVYRFLFIKESTLVYFATEGTDIAPISIQTVIDWHLPITENWDMTLSKYASRMSLGYSSSIPTMHFKPEEIIYIDDVYSETASAKDDSTCMTDGCGIISCTAMKEIIGYQETDKLPCAIQGRIGGAKGIWIIAPDLDFECGKYIKIRKSQDKFRTGLVQPGMRLDPCHYTLDLVKNSICIYPSNLNVQFIQVLSAGGVPADVFIEILKEYLHRLATIVTENQSVKILRDWLVKTGHVMGRRWESEDQVEKGLYKDLGVEDDMETFLSQMESESGEEESKSDVVSNSEDILSSKTYDQLNKYSGYPGSGFEAVIRMLDSGFDISNAFIATRITNIFRQLVRAVNMKYKIEVEQSCTVTCIPDPTGTLESDEVYLQLSTRRVDEKTGIRAGLILGDVVVTRNPCGLKSDIQKVKAIDCPQLRMYTDLVVFSTKGDASLASKLGGGDYDGDLIFCCWDERIVKPFVSTPVVKELPRVTEAFEKDKTTIGKYLGSAADTEKALQTHFVNVQIPDSTLGLYENWRTVLAENSSLDDPDVAYLAQMCAKLVDAPKQGLQLKISAAIRDRSLYSKIPYPEWYVDKKCRQRDTNKKSYKDVKDTYKNVAQKSPLTTMDCLYQTLVSETEAFTRYTQSMFAEDDVPVKDPELAEPWFITNEYAKNTQNEDLLHDLCMIRDAVLHNMDSYNTQSSQVHLMKEREKNTAEHLGMLNDTVSLVIESAFASFSELELYIAKEFHSTPDPSKFVSSVLTHDTMVNRSRQTQRLKASYAYSVSVSSRKYSKYCYVVAFDALRRIKADACARKAKESGFSETVSVDIYKSLTIDRKWIRKIKDSNVVEES
ncbi:RNA dependent RNA polymerase-domain-containing protein [Sporodiniella umbellata]|nr:RNA dependent RNA polymerase-domain-containing protein [Sporodiniella umbellata]